MINYVLVLQNPVTHPATFMVMGCALPRIGDVVHFELDKTGEPNRDVSYRVVTVRHVLLSSASGTKVSNLPEVVVVQE